MLEKIRDVMRVLFMPRVGVEYIRCPWCREHDKCRVDHELYYYYCDACGRSGSKEHLLEPHERVCSK